MRLIHFPGHHVEHENVWSNSWNTQYIPSRPARRKHYRSHKTRSGNVYSESWNTNSKPRVERENVASNSRDTHSKPSRPSAKALSNSWNTQSKQACPAQRMYDPTHGKRNPSKLVQRKEGMIQLMERTQYKPSCLAQLKGLSHLPRHHVQHEEGLIQLMEHAVQDAVPAAFRPSAPPRLRASRQVRAESRNKSWDHTTRNARHILINFSLPPSTLQPSDN